MHSKAVAATMSSKEVQMHVLMLTLTVAFVVCVVLLVAFGVFTTSRFADRVDHLHEPGRR
jgi:hypothetical protein